MSLSLEIQYAQKQSVFSIQSSMSISVQHCSLLLWSQSLLINHNYTYVILPEGTAQSCVYVYMAEAIDWRTTRPRP